jgi:hypothetical protein
MSEVIEAAVETGGWLRGKRYRQKYQISDTTFWKLRKLNRIEVREVDGLIWVRDHLPESSPKES